MSMRSSFAPLSLLLVVAACGVKNGPTPDAVVTDPVEIRFFADACFGECPVYRVTLYRDGRMKFVGERYTAVTGERLFTLSPATFNRFADLLAPLKPARGSIPKHRACNMGDTASHTITWIGSDGAQQSFCIGDHGEIKDVAAARNRMDKAVETLGVERLVGSGWPSFRKGALKK